MDQAENHLVVVNDTDQGPHLHTRSHDAIIRPLLILLIALAASLPAQVDPGGPDTALAWNQWRGAQRDGLSPDTGLATDWPDGGPSLLWKVDGLGLGFSSVAFAGQRIFTMGQVRGAAHLFCLDLSDGAVQWSARIGASGGSRQPGPRATPSTDGKLVFGLGYDGELACLAAESGEEKWRKNLYDEFDGEIMSGWGYSESPLLDGDLVLVTPGGSAGSVVALNKTSGALVWQSGELTDEAAYSSLVPAVINGTRQYIVLTARSVAGIAATDGGLLWRGAFRGSTAVCATPIYRDGFVFVTAAYSVGCKAFKVTEADGQFQVSDLYAGMQLQNHHGGVVAVDGHVYGFGRRNLKCIEIESGEVLWENRSVGKGSITYADGHLIVRGEAGRASVALVAATPTGYVEKGRFDQPDRTGVEAWAHPVVFGGKLYIRDQGILLCYDLRSN